MSTCVWVRGAVSNPDHDCSLRHPLVPQLVGVASLVSLGVTFVCLKIFPQIQKAPQKSRSLRQRKRQSKRPWRRRE